MLNRAMPINLFRRCFRNQVRHNTPIGVARIQADL